MPITGEPEIAVPGTEASAPGDGPSFRRFLVAVRSPAEATRAVVVAARARDAANGLLRLARVHIYDPAVPGYPGRFFPETMTRTRLPCPAITCLRGIVPDQVMRHASCPALTVHPSRKATGNASR